MITDQRKEKFRRVAAARQEMTVILENVHDPHNIGAVLRSCDAVGIQEIYVLYTDPKLYNSRSQRFNTTSTGVKKWMQVHVFDNVHDCFDAVEKKYDQVFATHLDEEAVGLYELDMTQKVALLFGNEHEGITPESLSRADKNFIIPQVGMVQSLNISVACAVSIYEAQRQRKEKGMYSEVISEGDALREGYFSHYISTHKQSYRK